MMLTQTQALLILAMIDDVEVYWLESGIDGQVLCSLRRDGIRTRTPMDCFREHFTQRTGMEIE
jgi:hypothetical protein